MIFNLIVAGMVLGLAYTWMVRGFFNAFIHLLCVLVAGAVAFSVWEPLAYMLVDISPERGLFSFIEGMAWGAALIVPFSVALLLIRVLTDKIVKANLNNYTAADYAGGAVCGLGIGIITTGVLVLAMSTMRLNSNFLGYQPIYYSDDRASGAGSLVARSDLWLPVDRVTAALYRGLSTGSMSSSNPLARWHPALESSGFAARISPGNGGGRNAIAPSDFRVVSTYTVGSPEQPLDASELLAYEGGDRPQMYLDPLGRRPGDEGFAAKGYLAGYVIEFEPGAKERGKQGGQVMLSSGQVNLLIEDTGTGETLVIYPIAAISEGADADGRLGRWRFDSKDVFISSVGGQSRFKVGVEFLVPEGARPLALTVRQSRRLLEQDTKPSVFAGTGERDRRVRSGGIFAQGGDEPAARDDSNAVTVAGGDERSNDIGVNVSAGFGEVLSSQSARSRVTLNDANEIVEGEAKFDHSEIGRGNVPNSRELRVDRFAVGSSQSIVQVDMSAGKPISLLSKAARSAPTDQPIVLVDTDGDEYEAIGFAYWDRELFHIRYTPGATLGGVADTPPISSARDDQRLVLVFIVTEDVEIAQLAIGDVVIAKFEPALVTEMD